MKTYNERSEAVAENMTKLKKRRRTRNRILAGTGLCLAVILVAAMFIPYDKTPPSVEQYARNPYYKVIRTINQLTYEPPRFDNFFGEILYGGMDMFPEAMAPGDAVNGAVDIPSDDLMGAPGENGGQYVEVTDNQVQGVTEADIFKRSDKYLYYLNGTWLQVYSVSGPESTLVGTFDISHFIIPEDVTDPAEAIYVYASEMYLSADCTTVTLVMRCTCKYSGATTVILNLDVTDPEHIRPVDYVCFPGSIVSTRMVGQKLLLTYLYRISGEIDYDKPETYVPSYGKPGDLTCVEPDDIICPDTATNTRYTVVCQLDSKTLEVEDTKALLSYAQQLYVSENAIYATQSYSEKKQVDRNVYTTQAMTKITGIAYGGDKLQYQGSIDVEGNVKNQYAMDEYEGILRVVTNTTMTHYKESMGELHVSVSPEPTQRNVNLYCIDLKAWEVEALVGGFAPVGERAESVRFDGNTAYVCTAEVITLTDPVYFFDLSDLENITYTDTGTIDGYSSSLVQLGDGFLLGIGFGGEGQMKIEVYEEYQGQVVSVDAWEETVSFSQEYKAYFIDREKDLVGLAVYRWDTRACEYLLLQFDGYQLCELLRVPMESVSTDTVRACMVGEEIYILSAGGLEVETLY